MRDSCVADDGSGRVCRRTAAGVCGARKLAAGYTANAAAAGDSLAAIGVRLNEDSGFLFYTGLGRNAERAAGRLLLEAAVCDLPAGGQREVAVRLLPGWAHSAEELLAAAAAVEAADPEAAAETT